MEITLIEERNKPIRTKIAFSRKEYPSVPEFLKKILEANEKHQTSRTIWFVVEGDLLNGRGTDDNPSVSCADSSLCTREPKETE